MRRFVWRPFGTFPDKSVLPRLDAVPVTRTAHLCANRSMDRPILDRAISRMLCDRDSPAGSARTARTRRRNPVLPPSAGQASASLRSWPAQIPPLIAPDPNLHSARSATRRNGACVHAQSRTSAHGRGANNRSAMARGDLDTMATAFSLVAFGQFAEVLAA